MPAPISMQEIVLTETIIASRPQLSTSIGVVGAYSYRIVARASAALMQAASLITIARSEGVVAFGTLSISLAVGSLVGLVLSTGSSVRALRLGQESDIAATTSAMFVARCASGILSALTAFIVGVALQSPLVAAAALGMVVLSDQMCDLEQAILAGREQQIASANWLFVQRIVPLASIIVLSHSAVPSVVAYGIGAVIVLGAVLRRPIKDWVAPGSFRAFYHASKGYWVASISGSIITLDSAVVRAVGSPAIAGIYAAASRATAPMFIFVGTLLSVMTPRASRERDAGRRSAILRVTMRTSVLTALPFIALSPLIADLALRVLGPQYESARPYIISFIIGASISGVSQAIQARLYTNGSPAAAAICIGSAVLLGLGILAGLTLIAHARWLWLSPVITQTLVLVALLLGAAVTSRRVHHISVG